MGRELACRLGRCGVALELSDVDGAGLEMTAARCRRAGASVRTHRVDVVDMQAVRDHADDVVARRGPPSLVVNNAGITRVHPDSAGRTPCRRVGRARSRRLPGGRPHPDRPHRPLHGSRCPRLCHPWIRSSSAGHQARGGRGRDSGRSARRP
ncbi:SDR family NAD(P)-dependent oxidoreductase [Gordonia sp. ABSL11-1]|nr:SDR family NAD(P)-dependent oxidoreductase [Gordonia sp. ABSL11-1]MDL9946523.1 SDR family NAD(P)-dependent oxidoreductase [Gordonia sp. ABSL11-1]